MSTASAIRVVIVDDHPVVGRGLGAMLGGQPDVAVVAEAGNAAEAATVIARTRRDVVLLDLRLPDASGTEAIAKVVAVQPGARILVVSSYSRPGDVRSALEVGALGYAVKDAVDEDVVGAVRTVARGSAFVSPSAADGLAREQYIEGFTPREQEIMEIMAEGCTNDQIAALLGLTIGTTKNYVHAILLKLCVNDRTAAVAAATRIGVLKPR
ncbi:MAG: response regulator transcription factor [Acidobacteria bacterium]|nr:response regulator transcription factor [Acidobacteriota bacterium]